jgi:hydroxymethylbilane synthase
VIGGKGVFTKELEDALIDRRVDVAVHSLKDLPTIVPEGLRLAAIGKREDPRDALILRKDADKQISSLADLPAGAVIGTSSPRRLAQLQHIRPDVLIKDLRGNVDTRLRKLDEGQYDALILAAAGLRRLGLQERVSLTIAANEMVPAVGQGAIGIQTRANDPGIEEVVAHLDHFETSAACASERALLRELGGGCQLPIAAHGAVSGGRLTLDGLVASRDGTRVVRERIEGTAEDGEQLGRELAQRLLANGARMLLES